MLRILIAGFCGLPAPDRAGVQVGHIVRALARHNNVDVLVARRSDQAYVERTGAARILRVPMQNGDIGAHIAAYRRALKRQLEGADYDIVYFRDAWSGGPVLEMKRQVGYAAVFDAARGPISGSTRRRQGELLPPQIGCLQAADLVLAGTEMAREHFARITHPEKIHVVPPGVDVDEFDWDEPRDHPPRVLYVGTIAPGRGVRVLLRAMVDIARHSDAILTLAGPADPGFARTLENAAHELGIGKQVQLIGEVKHHEVPALISRASVCVVPAAADLVTPPVALYPTKILEFLACMRPVVAPRAGTVELLCRDGEHALLFRPGDPADLTRQIARFLAEPKLAEKLARAGYDHVRGNFTASGTRRALRRAHQWLAAQPRWGERFAAARAEQAAISADIEERRRRGGEATDIDTQAQRAREDAGRGRRPIHEDTSPGDVTTVDFTGHEGEATHDTGVTTFPESEPARAGLDQWVVEDLATRESAPLLPSPDPSATAGEEEDSVDEGTPIDLPALPRADGRENAAPGPGEAPAHPTALTENRFVAGELEIPSAPAPSAAPAPVPEDDFDLTALSTPLGTPLDSAPGSKSD